MHIVFTIFNLAFVGFIGYLLNLLLTFWCMSIYYTLQQCNIILYLLFLCSAITTGILEDLFGFGEEAAADTRTSVQIIGILVNVVFYCIIVFFVAQSYYSFYKSGGIKGTKKTRSEYEEYLQ